MGKRLGEKLTMNDLLFTFIAHWSEELKIPSLSKTTDEGKVEQTVVTTKKKTKKCDDDDTSTNDKLLFISDVLAFASIGLSLLIILSKKPNKET